MIIAVKYQPTDTGISKKRPFQEPPAEEVLHFQLTHGRHSTLPYMKKDPAGAGASTHRSSLFLLE